jgi:luciferase family oxidoreductase group 1
MALRRDRPGAEKDFLQQIQELNTYFSAENSNGRVRAIPGEGLDIPMYILGSSTDSAYLAAYLGLPYAFASHFAPALLHEALRIYRENFRPSAHLKTPYTIACVNVIAAETDKEAERLATSFYQFFLGIVRNYRMPLQPPVDSMDGLWNAQEEATAAQMLYCSFIGSAATIEKELQEFIQQTAVNELMVTGHIYDHQARLHSYEILNTVLTTELLNR